MDYRLTRMEVSLENYRKNYNSIRDLAKKVNSKIIAVLKGNAYGMGAIPVAWTLKGEGADFFGLATPDEAIEFREAGINDPLIVLGSSPYSAAELYVKLGVRAAITDFKMAEHMSAAAVKLGRPAFVHIKIDSGMGRIGFFPEAALDITERIYKLPGVEIEGIFTHFASSDDPDLTHTREQFRRFKELIAKVRAGGIAIKMVHTCNSGAVLAGLSEMFLDAVRPGQILNGILPSRQCGHSIEILPSFELKTAVGVVRELPEGMGIGYGLSYKTKSETKTAVLPIGYADGYNRALSNCGEVLIQGTRCAIIGKISMDQCVVDVSHIKDINVGDEAVLIGRQGNESITLQDIADKISQIPLAAQVMFTSRVPRVYV